MRIVFFVSHGGLQADLKGTPGVILEHFGPPWTPSGGTGVPQEPQKVREKTLQERSASKEPFL